MSQIDSRIAMGFQPQTQLESPVNALARVLQVQGLQQQTQLGQMKMDEARRGQERQNRLASLLQGQYDTPEARESALMSGGFIEEATGLQKSRADAMKAQADVGKTKVETEKTALNNAMEKVKFAGQLLGGVKDQASYDQARALAQQNGLDVSSMPAQYDPAMVSQRLQQAMSVQQRLEQALNQDKYQLDVRKQNETERNNRTQNAISQGNLNLRRQEFDLTAGNVTAEAGGPSQAGLTKQFGKAPPGYRWKPDGSAEPIPGGPADIKAGEAGAKAQGRADAAALAADNVLSAVEDAKGMTTGLTAGPMSLAAQIPGTDARNLQAKLETIKANLGFDRLQQMREMSPTGGALGAVAVQELIALQSTVASLDQAQSPSQLRDSLTKIEGHYKKWLDTVNKNAPNPVSRARKDVVNVQGKEYARPANMTDQQWADYKKAVGASQ